MKKTEQSRTIAAIYKRLSDDDDQDGTSVSIETQGKILTDYCNTHGFLVYDHYSDDGYTGTNFNRPDFQRMMKDAKEGRFNTVIVKDLSRFGRNYLQVGTFISETFPQMGIRFIAVGDDVDTEESCVDYDLMFPIKNIFNEYYPADCSRKTRQAFIAKAKNGEFIGSQAPYGYRKSKADKHVLEIDDETAPTVLRIFRMAAYQGYGYNKIARVLSAEHQITPAAYQAKIAGRKYSKDPFDWNLVTIYRLVRNEIYLGHFISGKRRKQSFKSKKQVAQSEDKWIVIRDRFPALIPEQLWEDAHAALGNRKRETESGFENIFAGLLKCHRCGHALGPASSHANGGYYMCNTYKKKGKDVCTSHYIKYDEIYTAVLNDLRDVLRSVREDRKGFIDAVTNKVTAATGADEKRAEKEIAELESKIAKCNAMFRSLYQDRLSGLLTEGRFRMMSEECETEQEAAQKRLMELKRLTGEKRAADDSAARFVKIIEQYDDITELNRDLVNTLISRILVGDRYNPQDQQRQEIVIEYRFIGDFQADRKIKV